MGRTASTEPQCLYSRAIPLLPLWAVRPVQSLSACTVELYLYSPVWAVQQIESLRACTGVHFTLPFTFTMLFKLQLKDNPNSYLLLTSKDATYKI